MSLQFDLLPESSMTSSAIIAAKSENDTLVDSHPSSDRSFFTGDDYAFTSQIQTLDIKDSSYPEEQNESISHGSLQGNNTFDTLNSIIDPAWKPSLWFRINLICDRTWWRLSSEYSLFANAKKAKKKN